MRDTNGSGGMAGFGRPRTVAVGWQSLFVGFGLLWAVPCVAQPEGPLERLDSHQGLSHNSIGALLEDRQGFLWIGTLDGLNRFDGVELDTWRHDADDPSSLSSNIVNALLEDTCGNLWVGTSRGLDHLRRKGWSAHRFRQISIPSSSGPPADVPVRALLQDGAGAIWAGLGDGLLRYPAADQAEVFRHDPADPRSLPPGEVIDLVEDARGALWALTTDGQSSNNPRATLSRFDPGRRDFDHVTTPKGWVVAGLSIDATGKFWLNVSGLATFDPQSRVFEHPIVEAEFLPLADAQHDSRGDLWLPSDRGFLHYRPSTEVLSEVGLLSDGSEDRLVDFATAFVEGRGGLRWFGTRGGLFLADPQRKPFVHRHRRSSSVGALSSDRISAVLVDHLGAIWLGTYGSGLDRLDTLEGPAIPHRHRADDPDSLCHDTVWDLEEAPNGDLWLAVDDGLCRWRRDRNRFQRVDFERLDLQRGGDATLHRGIRRLLLDPEGRLWLATATGLQSYDPSRGEVRIHHPPDPGPQLAHSLYLDPQGVLWIGTQGANLRSFDTRSQSWSRHTLEVTEGRELSSEGIFDIRPRGDGSLWLASGDGLSLYDPGRGLVDHWDTGDGLPGSSVFSILAANEGPLWLGTNQGLSRFDPRAEMVPRFRNFVPGDGIGNLEFNRQAAARTAGGTFLIGGMDGLTIFHPDRIRDNPVKPRVALTEVRIARREGERLFTPGTDSALVLEPDEASFSVEFAALSFTNAERNRYRVRLEGFDTQWIDHGSRRYARYHRLPPGSYRLRVQGSNNDGQWGDEEANLAIRVLPTFWQTWWFRGLLVAGALALLLVVHRTRVARLLEIERLRLRIADDLHDDLSSELSGIALTMEMLQRRRIDDPQAGRIAQVRERSLVMLDRLRDIVWCVDPAHDTQEALVRKLRTVAETLLVAHDYELTTDLDGGAVILPVRRGVLLVFKEALHNVVRHAGARQVDLRLRQLAGTLELRVRDDGGGIDPRTLGMGSGLASMRRRALAMGGTLEVLARPQGGTEIRLVVPTQPSPEAPGRPRTAPGPEPRSNLGEGWALRDSSTPSRSRWL